jgi:arginase
MKTASSGADSLRARRPVHIIGVPIDLGAGRRGVDMGPSALRIAGLDRLIAELGYPVVDLGDLIAPIQETTGSGDPRKKYAREIAAICAELFRISMATLAQGALPLVLGGDHSIGAGSVAATARDARDKGQSIGLLWVDAHGDMNTPATTGSGNVHGMPLAALLGNEPSELAEIGGFSPKVDPRHTVIVGVRNLDAREREAIQASHVRVYTMKDVDRAGIAAVVEEALVIAGTGTAGVHVSFDLDVCDPSIAPGVGTPVKGGLDYREAHTLMEIVADSGLLLALDMVEVNPILDVRNATAELGAELIQSALGLKIL